MSINLPLKYYSIGLDIPEAFIAMNRLKKINNNYYKLIHSTFVINNPFLTRTDQNKNISKDSNCKSERNDLTCFSQINLRLS